MAPRRKLDWDEAKRLREEGLSFSEIGRRFGVTDDAVRYACQDGLRERVRAAALETMRRKRKSGEYRHHDLSICPNCRQPKSRHGRVCRACVGRPTVSDFDFAWRVAFAAEPDGSFAWGVFANGSRSAIQSGLANDWDSARLAAIESLYPPSELPT